MNSTPQSHRAFIDFVNGSATFKALADRIRSYERVIKDNPRGRSLPYAQLSALISLRDQQPNAQLTSLDQVRTAGIFSSARIGYLLDVFREENELRGPLHEGPFYMGRRYVIMHPDFFAPALHPGDFRSDYSLYLISPDGSQNYNFVYDRDYLQPDTRGPVRFEVLVPYFIPEGRYYMEYRNLRGDVLPVGLAFNVAFKPYVIELGDNQLMALRYDRRVDPVREDDRQSYLVVLSGKEFENAPANSRSVLRAYVPGKPDEPLINDRRQGSGDEAEYFTDVKLARLSSFDKLDVLAVMGAEQSAPRNKLMPTVVVFDEEGGRRPLALQNGGQVNELRLQVTTQPSTVGRPDFGGMLVQSHPNTGLDYVTVIPQVSHLIEDFEVMVKNAPVHFIGNYSGKLSLRSVDVPDAKFGDSVQRAMQAIGQVDTRIDRPQLVVFCKALVLAFDFLDRDTPPHLTRYLQVDDPFAVGSGGSNQLAAAISAAQNLQPGRDVFNPGVTPKGKSIDKGVRPKELMAEEAAGKNTNAGGRRYGLIKIGRYRSTNAGEILSIGHSLPRKGAEDGTGNTGKFGLLPFQTPVTLYPMLNSHYGPASFYPPQWSFKNDGRTPGRREKNGNETYLYRFFPEAFRKAAEKEGALQKLVFFNGKQLLGGTPPRSIDSYRSGKIIFPVSQAPFLSKFPVRTTFIQAENGADVHVMEDVIALDLLYISFPDPLLLVWRRKRTPATPPKMIDYKGDFGLGAYAVRQPQGLSGALAFELLDTDFGNEQPYLADFDEIDTFQVDNSIGVQGNSLALVAPFVQFNGDFCLLTASVAADGVSVLAYHLYTAVQEREGEELKFRKKYANISVPDGFKVVRISNQIETALPDNLREGNYTVHETVFVMVQEGGESTLILGRIGRGANGGLALVAADLVTDNDRFA